MKLTQGEINDIIKDLKPSKWEYSSSETLSNKIAETLNVQSTELKNIVAYELIAYEKYQKNPHKRVALNGADFEKENNPPPEKKRYKSLNNVTSCRDLLYRTDHIFAIVKQFTFEESLKYSWPFSNQVWPDLTKRCLCLRAHYSHKNVPAKFHQCILSTKQSSFCPPHEIPFNKAAEIFLL